ncbi:hypothetical protein Esi_0202_0032 [Ectocarpus siliculosus]|uniref:Uncharacterized protein n=1 Tax=Ectocarpus siliculosus TaxID=2880 RepID=D8LI55_ECTSI|nr:hypothetical protein Esi_0202_0032 [Ectocarpus siliculosus]|eukprot:CBN79391.1 hypothetical protein Esi_0202_0032 [Ectocarpus siliculosus]
MGDVIEACADGGFDIPATTDTRDTAGPLPRVKTQSSAAMDDRVEPKPRRVKIQLDDDEDDDGDGDGDENGPGRNILGRTPPTASVEEGLTDEKAPLHNVSNAAANASRNHEQDDEKATDAPATSRPEYRIYKIEMPGEDPTVEIVCSFSDGNLAAPISTARKKRLSGCPSVKISSDGRKFVVERNPAADAGDGGGDGVAEKGRFRLQLPQRVVPTTAMSFFRKGQLTVRATLATSE